MVKVVVDLSLLKNEITKIHAEAFGAIHSQSDNQRRDALLRVVEMLKTLKSSIEEGQASTEVK